MSGNPVLLALPISLPAPPLSTITPATSTSHQKCDWAQTADLLTVH